jgi:hypothetical protein
MRVGCCGHCRWTMVDRSQTDNGSVKFDAGPLIKLHTTRPPRKLDQHSDLFHTPFLQKKTSEQ